MLFIRIAHVFSKHNDGIVEFKNEWKRFTTASTHLYDLPLGHALHLLRYITRINDYLFLVVQSGMRITRFFCLAVARYGRNVRL